MRLRGLCRYIGTATNNVAEYRGLIAGLELAAALAPAAASKEAHRTLPLAADGRLAISTYKGSITVTCWDKPEVEISATLYYQATPPFFLQDRFCTAKGTDVDRLRFLTSQLNLTGTRAANWKLDMVSTGSVAVQ